jgi:hypothetical protein
MKSLRIIGLIATLSLGANVMAELPGAPGPENEKKTMSIVQQGLHDLCGVIAKHPVTSVLFGLFVVTLGWCGYKLIQSGVQKKKPQQKLISSIKNMITTISKLENKLTELSVELKVDEDTLPVGDKSIIIPGTVLELKSKLKVLNDNLTQMENSNCLSSQEQVDRYKSELNAYNQQITKIEEFDRKMKGAKSPEELRTLLKSKESLPNIIATSSTKFYVQKLKSKEKENEIQNALSKYSLEKKGSWVICTNKYVYTTVKQQCNAYILLDETTIIGHPSCLEDKDYDYSFFGYCFNEWCFDRNCLYMLMNPEKKLDIRNYDKYVEQINEKKVELEYCQNDVIPLFRLSDCPETRIMDGGFRSQAKFIKKTSELSEQEIKELRDGAVNGMKMCYKVHLQITDEYLISFLEDFASFIAENKWGKMIYEFKVCTEDIKEELKKKDPTAQIVLYLPLLPGTINEQHDILENLLQAIAQRYKNLPDKAILEGCPRMNKKISRFIYLAQGDGNMKLKVKRIIENSGGNNSLFHNPYNEDYTFLKGCEFTREIKV